MAATTASEALSSSNSNQAAQKLRSLFDLPTGFFDTCRILSDGRVTSTAQSASVSSPFDPFESYVNSSTETLEEEEVFEKKTKTTLPRWSCNTCKAEFESLQDQRSHFKSDIHRFNVKLSIAGKDIVKEEDFDESTSVSLLEDFDISSISGSEDEAYKGPSHDVHGRAGECVKQKLYIRLQTEETVSIWKCLLLAESENLLFDNGKLVHMENGGHMSCLSEDEIIGRLKCFIHEPRDSTHLRILLLASGGHFAGCVFDGNSVVAHKTFHRYVVRGKAGKKQSSKDASGKAAHSAGASLRRYNELALKKNIQELLATWKPYFDSSSFVFIYAPSNNRQLLFNGEKPYFSHQHCVVQHVPLTVRRPTLKEAKRIYYQLTHMIYEGDDRGYPPSIIEDLPFSSCSLNNDGSELNKEQLVDSLECREAAEACSSLKSSDALSISSDGESEVIGTSTPLHEASISNNAQNVLELLEQGLDPCIKDERGRTPYTLATEKEVRNTFRRFMALNLDKWDWNAAKVPSPLTKEMEESQAAKQVEKDAKGKARSKELKKLRKAKEKQAQVQAQAAAALTQHAPTVSQNRGTTPVSVLKGPQSSSGETHLSKEEELKRAQAAEREKRAAAAERRIAVAAALTITVAPSSSDPKSGEASDIICSCCKVSLAGKIPFHRYHYKYCSTSCMHVHRDILEDG